MPKHQGPLARRAAMMEGSKTILIAGRAAEMRRQGVDVASLSVGEPNFETPEHIKDACRKALAEGFTHYTPAPGIPELREAIAASVARDSGIPCEAAHAIATPTKHGLFASALAFIDEGDEVLLPDPSFVSYAPMVRFAGGRPVWVPTSQDDGFGVRATAVAERVTKRTKMIWLCSPSNPTGGVDDPKEVKAVAELAADHDFLILSDEIYHKLQYDGTPFSPASVAFDRTITVGGLSKSHAMTGWRAGWLVADAPLVDAVARIQSQSITHVASFVQKAMVAALTGPHEAVAGFRKELQARRDETVATINKTPGLETPMPKGAFYAWVGYDLDMDSEQVAEYLLESHHVAVVPGSAFGPSGRRRLRISFGSEMETVRQGLRRLTKGLQELQASPAAPKQG
jgi:aspartate aminotransferase